MINDAINILDGKIINIAINFTVVGAMTFNKFEVLSACIEELKSYYSRKMEIGEPFYISDVYNQLNKLDAVIDVVNVNVEHKSGDQYSSNAFNINQALSDDGLYINCPDNAVFEIKFPDFDIKGTIR